MHEVSRRFLIPEYHSCKISGSKILMKGNNSTKISYEFFQFFIKYSIHHPLSADKIFKFLTIILFEIRHLQKISSLYIVGQRAVILQREKIQRKPKICVGYFSMRYPYMKFQDDISILHTRTHARTHTHTHTHTHKPKPICPHFFKVGGIKNEVLQLWERCGAAYPTNVILFVGDHPTSLSASSIYRSSGV